jgi:hypothetical protein
MTKERLEFYLRREKSVFGFNTENDDKIVGWIKLYKRSPLSGPSFAKFREVAEPEMVEEQMKITREPYRVNIAQVTREVFDGDKFPGNEDYLLNATYSFGTLDDVERFLKDLGYDLSNIKWGADVDFL